ncbi:MAG: hypothetical protein JRH14_06935 [Deltaproteobacteria bacterium]|nr:hypothetical protein [Deltaproteobacteria bacterium]
MKRTVSAFLMMVVLSACASSKSSTNDGSTIGKDVDVETMRPTEAAQVVREFQEAYGIPPIPAPDTPVTSMAQVLEIIRGDRVPEFEEARRFASGRQGPESLTLRAYLDLSYAGALMTAAWILDEERKQDLTELRQLTAARPLEANEGAQQDQARAAKLQAKTADLRKVVRALRVLSEEPLRSGSDLAEQAIRQDPTAQLAYLANANYFRLRGHWLEFDRMMRYAAEGEQDPPVRSYLRAMEAFERYVDPVRCEKLLKETLAKRPDFVRAQANLVLVDQGVEAKHAELQALKAMSPTHLVVRLAGPMIEQEFKTSEELNTAFAN